LALISEDNGKVVSIEGVFMVKDNFYAGALQESIVETSMFLYHGMNSHQRNTAFKEYPSSISLSI
jgi:hypothetical protein